MSRFRVTTLRRRIWRVWFVVVCAGAAVVGGSPGRHSPRACSGPLFVLPPSTRTQPCDGVTCVSSSQCWAVGMYVNSTSGVVQTLIEAWDGTSWSIVSSPSVAGAAFQGLNSVVCGRAANAGRLGPWRPRLGSISRSSRSGTAPRGPSSPRPTWVTTAAPVRCHLRFSSTCFAVGYQFNSTDAFGHPLIEKWNGTGWSAVHPPTPGMSEGLLRECRLRFSLELLGRWDVLHGKHRCELDPRRAMERNVLAGRSVTKLEHRGGKHACERELFDQGQVLDGRVDDRVGRQQPQLHAGREVERRVLVPGSVAELEPARKLPRRRELQTEIKLLGGRYRTGHVGRLRRER